jgi:hypothetical protein
LYSTGELSKNFYEAVLNPREQHLEALAGTGCQTEHKNEKMVKPNRYLPNQNEWKHNMIETQGEYSKTFNINRGDPKLKLT